MMKSFTVCPELPVQVNKQSGMGVVEKLKRDVAYCRGTYFIFLPAGGMHSNACIQIYFLL
jgi:hypothetical protein